MMEQMFFSSAVFLVILGQWQGFSALTPVFVQTGKDLVLDVKGADCSEDDAQINWKFNQKDNLVRLTCHKSGEPTVKKYQNRTEITEKTSLKLKNVQKSFSGVYSALRSSAEDKVVAEYNVTVEDPVSPVHLKVDSVLNSSDVCNLNVTCSTDDSNVSSSFTCENKTCKQDNGQQRDISKQGNLLHVYLSDGSVICNHSNQVSWANGTKEIEQICLLNYENTNTQFIIWVIISVCFILMIIVGIAVFFFIRKRQRPVNPESSALPAPADQPPGPEDAAPNTVYSFVQPHSQTEPPPTVTENSPETVYAQIEKPGRPSQTPEVCT